MLCGNLLIFNVDGRDVQYVIALNKKTGKTAWKTNRSIDYSPTTSNRRKAYCTPIVIESGGRQQLVSPGAKAMMGYDPLTGEELWKVRYDGWSITPRPLFGARDDVLHRRLRAAGAEGRPPRRPRRR